MNDSNPASSTEPTPTSGESPATVDTGVSAPPAMPTFGSLMAAAIMAGLAAGLVSWLIGETVVNAFQPPYRAQNVMGHTILTATRQERSAADLKNATLTFAILGSVLGAALGLAGGLVRKSTWTGLMSSLVGLMVGGVLGAGTSLAVLPVYFTTLEQAEEELSRDMMLPLLVHGGIWAACGLAGGMAFGIGLGAGRTSVIKIALGGLIGGLLGAVLYEVIAATSFPTDKTTSPLPTIWIARLLARVLVATLVGLLAAMSARQPAQAARAQ